MKIVAIVQTRMSSSRLPGKVLTKIGSKSMLEHVLAGVSKSKLINYSVVATTHDKSDDAIVQLCKRKKIKYFRGSMYDVLGRYYQAAIVFDASIIVRVCSDCPLIDGKMIDTGMKMFLDSNLDYFSNTVDATYPIGFNFEILTLNALSQAFKNAKDLPEREHVTPYIWKNNPKKFKIGQLKNPLGDKSKYRITVDTNEDMLAVEMLIKKFQAHKKGYMEIIKILDKHPEIVSLNEEIAQKKYGD